MPLLVVGAPFPFKIVFGIEDALRPAATAEYELIAEEKIAIDSKVAK